VQVASCTVSKTLMYRRSTAIHALIQGGASNACYAQRPQHRHHCLLLPISAQEEVEWGDLEVRASGLSFFCRLPLTPPGPVTDVKPGSETTSASNTQGSSTTRTLKSTSTSSTSQHDAPTHCSSSPHGDGNTSNSTWLQGASLQGGCTRFVFLLSPFYYRPAAEAITLLLHHMAWHSRLGFCSYLWWVSGCRVQGLESSQGCMYLLVAQLTASARRCCCGGGCYCNDDAPRQHCCGFSVNWC
jgi:hypothetical protein